MFVTQVLMWCLQFLNQKKNQKKKDMAAHVNPPTINISAEAATAPANGDSTQLQVQAYGNSRTTSVQPPARASISPCNIRRPAPAPILPLGPVAPAEAQKWLMCRQNKPSARYRMLCLAWAGGNSTIYRTWDLPEIEIVAVELPGRQMRLREPPLKNCEQIVDRLSQLPIATFTVACLKPLHDSPHGQALQLQGMLRTPGRPIGLNAKPLLLFGHSFGAMLAVLLAQKLIDLRAEPPRYLVLSGTSPLDDRGEPMNWSGMRADELIEYLRDLGGIPPEVAANRDLMNIFLPAIQADYTAIDNLKPMPARPLPCPILALAGREDDRSPPDNMQGWQRFTSENFELQAFEGSHFFIKDKPESVIEAIKEKVLPHLP